MWLRLRVSRSAGVVVIQNNHNHKIGIVIFGMSVVIFDLSVEIV